MKTRTYCVLAGFPSLKSYLQHQQPLSWLIHWHSIVEKKVRTPEQTGEQSRIMIDYPMTIDGLNLDRVPMPMAVRGKVALSYVEWNAVRLESALDSDEHSINVNIHLNALHRLYSQTYLDSYRRRSGVGNR